MDPSSGQNQEMASSADSLGNMLVCSKSQQERKPRPNPEKALKCPRCDSSNTKFCYYNNYSLSQPRYFCKSCRRYWTKGGTLRNVPVGGGCRKNKRSSSSSSSSKRAQENNQNPLTPNSNPLTNLPPGLLAYDSCNDLTLAFSRLQKQSCGPLGYDDYDLSILGNPNNTHCDMFGNNATPGFLDALRHGLIDSQNESFQNLYYGFGNGNHNYGSDQVENGHHGGVGVSGEMGFPYDHHHHHHHPQEISNATTTAVTVTTIKQELCNGRTENENRVLLGYPWQLNNGDQYRGNLSEIDHNSGRESWNGIAPSWHGLINSPLM